MTSTVEALERIANLGATTEDDAALLAREALPRARAEAEELVKPINALCEQTWRRDVQGACPVHGGDSCLVNPSAQVEELERLRKDRDGLVVFTDTLEASLSKAEAQLTKQAAVIEASIKLRAAGFGNTRDSIAAQHEWVAALDALTTDTGGNDPFETVRDWLPDPNNAPLVVRGNAPLVVRGNAIRDAHAALDRIEARLSTTEEALREISASLYLGDGYNELRRIARNALQPEQKEPIDR